MDDKLEFYTCMSGFSWYDFLKRRDNYKLIQISFIDIIESDGTDKVMILLSSQEIISGYKFYINGEKKIVIDKKDL